MPIDALKERLPDYAKDLKLNLSSLSNDETLTVQQRAGTLLASALASRNATVIREIKSEVAGQLDEAAENGAKAAASIMGMNNVYYRFVHLASAKEYKTLPAKLRMNVIGNPGVDKVDFELWSIAVSAVNGCGMCIDAHEKVLRDAGMSNEQIQTAVRIASVVHAVAATLDGEEALAASA